MQETATPTALDTVTPRTSIRTVTTATSTAEVTLAEYGEGRPTLLLHGGAGPQSVAGFASQLASSGGYRVIVPTHPGFGGTERPERLDSIRALAELYARLLDDLDVDDALVIGNSIGGWTAAELALTGSPRVGGLVLVDAVGLEVAGHPIADFFSLTMDQLAELSHFEPNRFRLDVSALPDAVKTIMAGNRASLMAYAGTAMADPTLLGRIAGIHIPALVVWGAADRVVDPEHGSAYAAGIPGATLDIIDEAGHLPQLETPDRLLRDVRTFAGGEG